MPAPPPPPERSMFATRAKKVKMATKSCPECDQQVPVACKSCPCGYVFINRKPLKIKHSEKSSPFTEIATAPPAFSNHHPDKSAAVNIKARASTSKKRMTEGSGDG
ncbi:UPF0547 protein C16orf87 isoform X3 [Physeter macrocephalus]|uniref:UPF0547 protein C16orf87 isoform X3 n=1 Tax=Physeter macrocephalus TaxID=9755 RepID=A0A455ACI1_PHYMC|nr:UPF0547 protein C16orf87 isoform X3 [Physeter catodon]